MGLFYHSGGGPLRIFNANELASSGVSRNPCSANLCTGKSVHSKILIYALANRDVETGFVNGCIPSHNMG